MLKSHARIQLCDRVHKSIVRRPRVYLNTTVDGGDLPLVF